MKAKKWCVSIISICVIVLFLFGLTTFILDPFWRYRPGTGPLSSYVYAEIYANPGLARHLQYDSVLVGTSMAENTDVDYLDELFHTRTLRLPYSGGTSFNFKKILDICFSSNNNIQKVFWELDEFQLSQSATEPRYPLPEYMYADDHWGDLKYLLNLDVFFHYSLTGAIATIRGEKNGLESRGISWNADYGETVVLAGYDRPEQKTSQQVYKGSQLEKQTHANLENIVEVVGAHPETEFIFFMPPFSILYWDRELRAGTFDATMDSVEETMRTLLQYDNVRMFYFQGEESIIADLDNYKDYSHYGPWINDKISEYLKDGYGEVTEANYQVEISEMKELIYTFDYNSAISH